MRIIMILFLVIFGYTCILNGLLKQTKDKRTVPMIAALSVLLYGAAIAMILILGYVLNSAGIAMYMVFAAIGAATVILQIIDVTRNYRKFNAAATAALLGYLLLLYILTVITRKSDPGYGTKMELFGFLKSGEHTGYWTIHWLENVLLFVPLGVLLPLTHQKKLSDMYNAVGSALFHATVIEALQLVYRLGICDIDDIIANAIGAALGWTVYRFFLHR